MRGERGLVRLSWLLLLFGAIRLFLLVLHEPMYGYANNYDFIRISSWFHLWADPAEAPEGFDPLKQHPSTPISTYRTDPSIEGERFYVTSDLIFVWTGLHVGRALARVTGGDPDRFDLRTLGVVRALALLAAGLFLTRRFLAHSARAGFVSALVFALVLADPVFSLLFNTLYSEFSTVLFSYLAAGQVIEAMAFGPWPNGSRWLVLAASFVLLAFSKVQYAGLPLAFVALLTLAIFTLHRHQPRTGAVWAGLAVALFAAGGSVVLQSRAHGGGGYAWSMRMGAATDTYFGAALPNVSDHGRGLALLGLPPRCAEYIGKNWYSPGMQPPPCPEVESVPRWKLLRLALDDPWMVVRVARQAVPLLQPFVVRYYGHVEGGDYEQADLRIGNGLASIGEWPEALPAPVFGALLGLTILGAAVAFVELARSALAGGAAAGVLLPSFVVVLALTEVYCFATSWVGAGWVDLARHSIVGQLAFLCLVVASPWQIVRSLRLWTGR